MSLGRVFRCHVIHHHEADNISGSKDIVIFNFHHIAVDAESLSIFQRDLKIAYVNSERTLEPPRLQYIDFSWHESQSTKGKEWENDIIFWKNLLGNSTSTAFLDNLPYDRKPRDTLRTGRGHSMCITLNSSLSQKINDMACDLQVTLNQLTLAAFLTFLFKLTQEADIQIGILTSNRHRHSEIADVIGFFVNTLPLRCLLNPNGKFPVICQTN